MKDKRLQTTLNKVSELKSAIHDLEKAYEHLDKLSDEEEKSLVEGQIEALQEKLKEINKELKTKIEETIFSKPLEIEKKPIKKVSAPVVPEKKKSIDPRIDNSKPLRSEGGQIYSMKDIAPRGLEVETIEKIRKKKEAEEKAKNKPKKDGSDYVKIASHVFSKLSRQLLGKKQFQKLEDDLKKANLDFTPSGYVSVILMTTLISGIVAGFLFFFFLFFNFGATLPIVTRATETVNERFLKVFWILFVVPIGTFLLMYLYPSMEKKSAEFQINNELPFATIHMSAISGSMINPLKIFEIILSTKEYPALEREFRKMINEINLYGYDMVSALKNTAANSPSKELAELFNGLATTVTSGGDLPKFFEKRADTLLFDYRIEQQKASRAAETAMDIYISVLIAGPMILMLLIMIMKLSGLGVGASIPAITAMIVLGVVVANIMFLTFLHLKKHK